MNQIQEAERGDCSKYCEVPANGFDFTEMNAPNQALMIGVTYTDLTAPHARRTHTPRRCSYIDDVNKKQFYLFLVKAIIIFFTFIECKLTVVYFPSMGS